MKKLSFLVLILSFLIGLSPIFSARASLVNIGFQRYGFRNLSQGQNIISQDIEAATGERIEVSVNIKNFSDVTGHKVMLSVYLPSGLRMEANSLTIYNISSPNNIATNIFLGDIPFGVEKNIVFRITPGNNLSGFYSIQAQASEDNIRLSASSTANITFSSHGQSSPTPTFSSTPIPTPASTSSPQATPTPSTNYLAPLLISKLGKNLSRGDTSWLKNIQAEPNDLLEFSIRLTANSSETVRGIYLRDALEQDLMSFVSGSVTINNFPASDTLGNGGEIYLGQMAPGEVKFIKFRVWIASPEYFPRSPIILTNRGQVRGDNIATASDIASVNVVNHLLDPTSLSIPIPTTTPLIATREPAARVITKIIYLDQGTVEIIKTARNVSQEQTSPAKQTAAKPGEEIEFTIQITSTSNRIIKRLAVKDRLSEKMYFTFNSDQSSSGLAASEIAQGGFALENLRPGETKTIIYRARILPETAFQKGTEELKNSVTVSGEGVVTARDEATVTVKTQKNNLLGATIVFGSFGFLLTIMLVVIAALLIILFSGRRRKIKNLPPPIN